MSEAPGLETTLRDRRALRGWSQDDLARRSGLSRAGVSAIETGRLVPSTAAALALASALGCRVEDLFRLKGAPAREAAWAWLPPPPPSPCRFWEAEIGGGRLLYPAEPTLAGMVAHDGVSAAGSTRRGDRDEAARTLVMAGCDPAAGLLASELDRVAGVRLIALPRSSRAALGLLGEGLVHVAGVHLAKPGRDDGNAGAVREALGPGYALVRAARWEAGIALAPTVRASSVRGAVGSDLRWIGREPGSGARECLDELLGDRRAPKRMASGHRGVAEAIRSGWAEAGVCLRLASEEAGLKFLPVRREDYDLCFPAALEGDRRIEALLRILRSPAYRAALADLPGYDSRATGEART